MAKTGGTQWNFQDKNQRVSRVNSEFLRNSISQHMCQDGSVNLPSQEVDAIIRNLSRKEKKISKMWWALGFAAIFSVALFALTFASALSANEASKESHVEGSQLVDLDGSAVQTANIESFATLFDLARFDQRTLAKVEHLSFILEGERTLTIEVADVMKDNGCGQTVQLFTASGNSIMIDGETGLAVAVIDGAHFVVYETQIESDRRSLMKIGQYSPRLYSAEEFFSAAHGLDSGRALSSESVSGWVQLAIAVGEEILDNHEAGRSNIEGEFESMFLSGVVEDSNTEFQMYYKNETTYTMRSHEGENKFQTIKSTGEHGLGYFAKSEDGAWTSCDPYGIENTLEEGSALHGVEDVVAGMCGRILVFDDHVITIRDIKVNTDGTELGFPSDEECATLRTPHNIWADEDLPEIPVEEEADEEATTEASEEEEGDRRGLWWSPPPPPPPPVKCPGASRVNVGGDQGYRCCISCQSHLQVGGASNWLKFWGVVKYRSYKKTDDYSWSGPGGTWYRRKTCTDGHVHAKMWRRGSSTYMAGFSGSDDIMDWVDNIAGAMNMGVGGYHAGFWLQASKMKNCFQSAFGNIPQIRYAVGHSLGGGVATVYSARYGGVTEVVTFAAPRSHSIFKGCVDGYRVYHDYDPVTHIPDFYVYKHGVKNVFRLQPQYTGGFIGIGSSYAGDKMIHMSSNCWNLPYGGLATATTEILFHGGIGIHNNYFPEWTHHY